MTTAQKLSQTCAPVVVSELCVVLPAHNEQDLLRDCLEALRTAGRELRRHHPEITFRAIVVLDDCADGSAEIVTVSGATAVTVQYQNVGAARREGARTALAQSISPPERIWLASADADCQVPADWLIGFVDAAARGYQLVAGMVRPTDDLAPEELRAWHEHHQYVEGHPHVHGANLGIRADAYSRLGGWSALSTGEDVDLVLRAEQLPDLPILRTARRPVGTSFRRTGRAPSGFADYLSNLTSTGSGDAA